MKRGMSKLEAANAIVSQDHVPAAGRHRYRRAGVRTRLDFHPDSTGEFAGSLFWVLLFSLTLSWFTAITLTPFFCDLFFKEEIREAPMMASRRTPTRGPYSSCLQDAARPVYAQPHYATVFILVSQCWRLRSGASARCSNRSSRPRPLRSSWLITGCPQGTDIRATDEDISSEIQEAFKGR